MSSELSWLTVSTVLTKRRFGNMKNRLTITNKNLNERQKQVAESFKIMLSMTKTNQSPKYLETKQRYKVYFCGTVEVLLQWNT